MTPPRDKLCIHCVDVQRTVVAWRRAMKYGQGLSANERRRRKRYIEDWLRTLEATWKAR